jgi:hypothetical protein
VFHFADVLRLLDQLQDEGVVADYAIGGAMAANFWDEAVATQDLDVAVVFGTPPSPLDPLRAIFDRLPEPRYPRHGEHIEIAGVPVQFLPAWSPLVERAIREAHDVVYDPDDAASPRLRVMTPTHLAAIWQSDAGALTPRRRERIARFREAGLLDDDLLGRLLSERHEP